MTTETSQLLSEEKLKINPQKIVKELDKYIIGQNDAKKEIAIAVRNRWRRSQLRQELAEEVTPRNILMIGPTGVGKTEIARRIAKIMNFPFRKVNATDYTTRGYHGLDVDHIIQSLIENSVQKIRELFEEKYKKQSEENARQKIKEILQEQFATEKIVHENVEKSADKNKFDEKKFINGKYDDIEIEIEISQHSDPYSSFDLPGFGGESKIGIMNISDVLHKAVGGVKNKKLRKCTVKKAIELLIEEENEKIMDEESIIKNAIEFAENYGIVFIDEIDKIIEKKDFKTDVNREGVQRDLLPLIEGSIVPTKFGNVKTNHILFIAAGAFHLNKPEELLPELQGRLPIQTTLNSLSGQDFERILCEVKFNLILQQQEMFKTEGVELQFAKAAIAEIARITHFLNQQVENIGARRLHAVIEKILKEINFEYCDMKDEKITIDKKYVTEKMKDMLKEFDLSKFII